MSARVVAHTLPDRPNSSPPRPRVQQGPGFVWTKPVNVEGASVAMAVGGAAPMAQPELL